MMAWRGQLQLWLQQTVDCLACAWWNTRESLSLTCLTEDDSTASSRRRHPGMLTKLSEAGGQTRGGQNPESVYILSEWCATVNVGFCVFHPPLSLTKKTVVVFVNRPHMERQPVADTVTTHSDWQLGKLHRTGYKQESQCCSITYRMWYSSH